MEVDEPENQAHAERRHGGLTCPTCGGPIIETPHAEPWGTGKRLLVCPDPDCANVVAAPERRARPRERA